MRSVLLLFLLGLAFAPVVIALLDASASRAAQDFYFERQESSLLALVLAGFLVWNRIRPWADLPNASDARASQLSAIATFSLGFALLLWSRSVAALDLHAFSLALIFLATCLYSKGWRGVWEFRAAFFVACFVLPIPAPLYNEIVWEAQRLATVCTAWVLETTGQTLDVGSMAIRIDHHDFMVIETCSGLRAVELLTLMSVLIVETSAHRSTRDWILVLLAAPLALLLNVVRVAAIVLYDSAAANDSNHAVQGLVSVFVGTGILYGVHFLVLGARDKHAERGPDAALKKRDDIGSSLLTPGQSRAAMALLVLVAAIGFGFSGPPNDRSFGPKIENFPMQGVGWTGSELDPDRFFFNSLPIGRSMQRRYERPRAGDLAPERIYLYVAQRKGRFQRARLSSTKFGWLGPDWKSERIGDVRLWQLGIEGVWYHATRGKERYLVLVWTLGEGGRLRESLSSALALPRPKDSMIMTYPLVLRLATPIRGGRSEALARERAEKIIHGFVEEFAGPFVNLGSGPAS